MGSTPRQAIFVTGAAAGIGRAAALRFAAAGWFVGLYDVDESGLKALAAQLGACACTAGTLDVTRPADWEAAIASFAQASGRRLDVLFNNAGVAVTRPFEEIEAQRHHLVVDVNLKGVINGCLAAHALLKATPGSRIVNMCSASALHGQPGLATYAATKAAIRSLTEALDIEWRSQGIRVVDVLPLFVDTAMVADEVSRMKTVQALGVRLQPEDVAAAVWKLANLPQRRLPLHAYVGWQTRLFAWMGKLSPTFLNHAVTARLAGY